MFFDRWSLIKGRDRQVKANMQLKILKLVVIMCVSDFVFLFISISIPCYIVFSQICSGASHSWTRKIPSCWKRTWKRWETCGQTKSWVVRCSSTERKHECSSGWEEKETQRKVMYIPKFKILLLIRIVICFFEFKFWEFSGSSRQYIPWLISFLCSCCWWCWNKNEILGFFGMNRN